MVYLPIGSLVKAEVREIMTRLHSLCGMAFVTVKDDWQDGQLLEQIHLY